MHTEFLLARLPEGTDRHPILHALLPLPGVSEVHCTDGEYAMLLVLRTPTAEAATTLAEGPVRSALPHGAALTRLTATASESAFQPPLQPESPD